MIPLSYIHIRLHKIYKLSFVHDFAGAMNMKTDIIMLEQIVDTVFFFYTIVLVFYTSVLVKILPNNL